VAKAVADCIAGKWNSEMLLLSVNPKVPLIWLAVVRLPNSRTFSLKAAAKVLSKNSISEKMNVFFKSKPIAMMSAAF